MTLLETPHLLGGCDFEIIATDISENILIYLDRDTQKAVLDNLAKRLYTHGYLFLGSSETIIGLTDDLRVMEHTRGLFVPNIKDEKNDVVAQHQA